jgi:PEP-CTERM motif
MRKIVVFLMVLAIALPVMADWNEGDPSKWAQLPDESNDGVDVDISSYDIGAPSWRTAADDFLCVETGNITNFHIWGSWKGDQPPTIDVLGTPTPNPMDIGFEVQIWSDNPSGGRYGYSVPSQLLWTGYFNNEYTGPNIGTFTVREYSEVPGPDPDKADFYTPIPFGPDFYYPNSSKKIYQYNLDCLAMTGENPLFKQQGTQENPIVYWMSVRAAPSGYDSTIRFGWKSSQSNWNDAAVITDKSGDDPVESDWGMLTYPYGHPAQGLPIDLAFVIQSIPEPGSLALIGIGLMALIRKK